MLSNAKNKKVDQGLLGAQVVTVLTSCVAIGLSLTSVDFDIALDCNVPGKEKHPRLSKWLPRDDHFRQTLVFMSMVVRLSLHVLLVAFGYSTLLSFASPALSLSILGGNFVIFCGLRVYSQEVGWRGLSVYNIKDTTVALMCLPLTTLMPYIFNTAAPMFLLRYQ